MKTSILLLASGRGERLGAEIPKAFVPVAGVPIVLRSARRLALLTGEDEPEIVLAVNPDDREPHVAPIETALREAGVGRIVDGGATRQESMMRAFRASADDADVVVVHDAARPFFPVEATRAAIAKSRAIAGGAVLAIRVVDTIKRVDEDGQVIQTLKRGELRAAQTPQVATRHAFARAIERAERDGFEATDDVSLLEHAGIPVATVEGSPRNIKITQPSDLELAERLAAEEEA